VAVLRRLGSSRRRAGSSVACGFLSPVSGVKIRPEALSQRLAIRWYTDRYGVQHTLTLVAAGSLAGASVGLAMAAFAWNNRERPAATQFALLMLAVAGWCVFAAAQMLAATTAEAYLFDRLVRASSTHVPPLALTFVLAYAGHEEWLTPKWLALLWAYPAIYTLLSLTAPFPRARHRASRGDVPDGRRRDGARRAGGPRQGRPPSRSPTSSWCWSTSSSFGSSAGPGQPTGAGRWPSSSGRSPVPRERRAFYTGLLSHPGLDPDPDDVRSQRGRHRLGLFRYNFLSVTPLASDVLIAGLPGPSPRPRRGRQGRRQQSRGGGRARR